LFLARHPESRDEVKGISVGIERAADRLGVLYVLEGNLASIVIPSSAPTRRGSKLWQHTCFEIFVSSGMPAYREFNFSPSGEWAGYAFSGYRQAADAEMREPSLAVHRGADRLELEVTLPLAGKSRLRIAVSAVVESQAGSLSYWALKHAPGKPDFHHADGFVLEL
jgi:hypothetical protein